MNEKNSKLFTLLLQTLCNLCSPQISITRKQINIYVTHLRHFFFVINEQQIQLKIIKLIRFSYIYIYMRSNVGCSKALYTFTVSMLKFNNISRSIWYLNDQNMRFDLYSPTLRFSPHSFNFYGSAFHLFFLFLFFH